MADASLITSLAPAFAAGFAVQRLIEIIDPVVPVRVSANRKKALLGFTSLGLGLLLAWGLSLQVLTKLGINPSDENYPRLKFLFPWLDYFVTGLVISAGTEGFNSILKFLEYRKEGQKTETVKEKLGFDKALSLSAGGLRTEGLMANTDLTLTTPDDIMQQALQQRVRVFRGDPDLALDFDNGKFNQHMVSDQEAQVVTLEATADAANEFQKTLNSKGKKIVRQSITVNTGYGAAIGIMNEAISFGADPKETFV
jgi:hypothetical protein